MPSKQRSSVSFRHAGVGPCRALPRFSYKLLRCLAVLTLSFRSLSLGFGVPVMGLCVLLWGCGRADPPAPPESPSATESSDSASPEATELLQKMRSVYRDAKSYTDNGAVVFYAVVRSTGSEQETPFTRSSLAFQRPNKFHVSYVNNISSPQEEKYQVVSNGTTVRSTADEIVDQVHEAIAPRELTAENFIPEPALRGALLQNSIENTLPQMALLLANSSEQQLFPGEQAAKMLSDGELGGRSYHRIEIPSAAGNRVLWIDMESYTLRRMEIPIDNQKDQLNSRNQFSKLSVWIDFEEVTIDSGIDSAVFQLAVNDGARRVRRFIPPPPPAPPEYLGKPVGKFSFQSLDNEEVTPQKLKGKVVVLDFWSTNCQPCQAQAPVLNQVYEQFQESGEVEFYAVSTDSRVVPNNVVKKTLASWGSRFPILRDLGSSGYQDLKVRQTPTLLLIDRDSRLQVFQIGAHQNPDRVAKAIQRLVDGEDIAAADRAQHVENLDKYQSALDAAAIQDSIVEIEIARPEVPPRRLPENLQLEQLWQTSTDQLQRPGDVRVEAAEGSTAYQLLVLDHGKAIVEIDTAGRTIDRHELPQHDEQSGGFLRSWSDANGQRWTLASGVGWQQIYVFDPQWEPTLSFPDDRHSGIGDVLFADLTGSGNPLMYVGYWGGLGVQGGTLDGRRIWSNRRLDHVLQIGIGPTDEGKTAAAGNRTTWCTSTRGTLMQLGADGKSIQERYLEGQAVMYFASHPSGEKHCGLSIDRVGQYNAFGFDQLDKPTWQVTLPPGEYVEQVPRVQSVTLPNGQDAWLVAAANGSLHWLSESGDLIARFDCGAVLTGVAMHSASGKSTLFTATEEHLTAWQVEVPPKAEPVESEPAEKEFSAAQPETDESETDDSETDDSTTDESETDDSTTDDSETDELESAEPAESASSEAAASAGR